MLRRFWIGFLGVSALVLLASISGPQSAFALTNCTVADLTFDAQEQQFLTLINNYRTSQGLPALATSISLNRAASWMAVDMATKGYFAHNEPPPSNRTWSQRLTDCGDSWSSAGENIAAGTVMDTAQEAFDIWRNSSGHNANMLGASYRQIGIARHYLSTSPYKWYWVTDFHGPDDGTRVSGGSSPTPTPSPSPTPAPSPYAVTWGGHSTPSSMSAGATANANVSFSNSGSQTWNASGSNPVRLSYHWRSGACPGTSNVVWDGRRAVLPGNVPSGGNVSNLAIQVVAPSPGGQYCLVYDVVKEGVTWFSSQGASTLKMTVNVQTVPYAVKWNGHTTPASMAKGATVNATVSFANLGSLTWNAGGANPVRLSYHWRTGACPGTSYAVWDGRRAVLPGDVATGGNVNNLTIQIVAPSSAGQYCLLYDVVKEGVTWFSSQGAATLPVNVTVSP
jgi:uncharacterized protein YkwD